MPLKTLELSFRPSNCEKRNEHMAYSRRQSSRRRAPSPRRTSSRTSYRSRAVRSAPRRRATSRRASSGGRTIRIELVTSGAGSVARPEIGMKPAAAPRKAMF